MKKLLFLLISLFTIQTVAIADNDNPIQVNQLPKMAQSFIKKHFPNNEVSFAKMESDFLNKSYEVIFSNGDKVDFDKKGIWKEVECKSSAVPLEVIPLKIIRHVKLKYPVAKITRIEKDANNYEIKLSSGWEIKFDRKFNVIDISH